MPAGASVPSTPRSGGDGARPGAGRARRLGPAAHPGPSLSLLPRRCGKAARATPSPASRRPGVGRGAPGRQAGARRRPAGRPLPRPLEHSAAPRPGRQLPLRVHPRARRWSTPGPCPAASSAAPSPFKAAPFGNYRVALTDPETLRLDRGRVLRQRLGLLALGAQEPGPPGARPRQDEYAPGDTATVQVRAPFPGKLLLTVERNGVVST